MEVSDSDGAGRKIGDEDDDLLSLHPRDRFPQELCPGDLRRTLSSNVGGSKDPDSYTGKTDTEKQKRLPHGFPPPIA
jgi:hypothetical protein